MKNLLPLGIMVLITPLAMVSAAQTSAGGDIGPKVLPSVVALDIQAADGRTTSGAGFLTVKDGLLATAWHAVSGAQRVVARFPNGEEYECSGVVDKDEKRDVALLRIKVFGRPLLTMTPNEILSLRNVTVAAVKDGAFGLVPARVAALGSLGGIDVGRLEGEIPEGSSGSPIVDAGGAVVGLLTARTLDGRAVSFLLPAAYVLALDASLPTQPWGGTAAGPAAAPAPAAGLTPDDEVDARLGRALMAVSEMEACLSWADEITRGYGFMGGVPDAVYQFQQNMDSAAASLGEVRTEDELRRRVGRAVLQALANEKAASESFIRAVVVGQQMKDWGAQSQDAQKRANSLRQSVTSQIAALKEDLKSLEASSAKFREFLPTGQRYLLGLAERRSGFRLGIITYPRNPFYLLVVYADSMAQKMGLKPGDRIVSVSGRTFTAADDIEEFKLIVKGNLGTKLEAVVERNGKEQTVVLKVPKEIPANALIVR